MMKFQGKPGKGKTYWMRFPLPKGKLELPKGRGKLFGPFVAMLDRVFRQRPKKEE